MYEEIKDITSRENQWVKMACAIKQKKGRQEQQRVFVEGWRIVSDAVATGIPDGICFVSPKGQSHDAFRDLYEEALELGWTFFSVTESVYDKIKDTKTPQGIAAMLPFFAYDFDELPAISPDRAVLYLRNIQDPGNLGTIIRTAAAANTGAILLSEDSVDVYNDKTIRSAMGAIFKIPIVQHVTDEQLDEFCANEDRLVYGTAAQGSCSYVEADYSRPIVLAFGNEGNGLSNDFLACCDEIVTIPMRSDTESLNLSMSVGIVLYKAWEGNGFKE